MNKTDRIKKHFSDNKNLYAVAAGAAFVGSAVTAVVLRNPDMMAVRQTQVLAYKSTQHLEVFVEALGDPGNIIQDLTTGTVYASQGQAARELGVSPARISEQLKGTRDHVNGHVCDVLGKASVAE